MTQYPEPRCKYCEHWQQHPEAPDCGLCRRYPPIPGEQSAYDWGDFKAKAGIRVETQAEDWCGEYSLSLERLHELEGEG